MYDKVVAGGQEITDLCYWPTGSDVRTVGGLPSSLTIYPLADKAERVIKEFTKGSVVLEYYGTAGRAAYHVQFIEGVGKLYEDGRAGCAHCRAKSAPTCLMALILPFCLYC